MTVAGQAHSLGDTLVLHGPFDNRPSGELPRLVSGDFVPRCLAWWAGERIGLLLGPALVEFRGRQERVDSSRAQIDPDPVARPQQGQTATCGRLRLGIED